MSSHPPSCHVCGDVVTESLSSVLQLRGCDKCYISSPLSVIKSEPVSPDWINKPGEPTTQAIAKLVSYYFIAHPQRWGPRLHQHFPDWRYDPRQPTMFPRAAIVMIANDLALPRQAVLRLTQDSIAFAEPFEERFQHLGGRVFINRIVNVNAKQVIGVGFMKSSSSFGLTEPFSPSDPWHLGIFVMEPMISSIIYVSIPHHMTCPIVSDPSTAVFTDMKFNPDTSTLAFVYADLPPVLYIVTSDDGKLDLDWSVNVSKQPAIEHLFPLKRGWAVVSIGLLSFMDHTTEGRLVQRGERQLAGSVSQAIRHFISPWTNLDDVQFDVNADQKRVPRLIPSVVDLNQHMSLRDNFPSPITNLSVIMHQKRIFLDLEKKDQWFSIYAGNDSVLLPDQGLFDHGSRDIAQLGQDTLVVVGTDGNLRLLRTKSSLRAMTTLTGAVSSVLHSELLNAVGRRQLWEMKLLRVLFVAAGWFVRPRVAKRKRERV